LRVGRFGRKDQHASLLSLVADVYLNEMGVTSRLKPVDTTSICKVKSDPEDTLDELWHSQYRSLYSVHPPDKSSASALGFL
jgi:hypothetical protein